MNPLLKGQNMKTAAIITEYNPFHNGHAWQLETVRRLSRADHLIVLMSGDFVQRGEPAVFDKYIRAKAALSCGADLVLELPCAAATGSAQRFAEGAAAVLDSLGCVDELWFGSENGRMREFYLLSNILSDEPEEYRLRLKTGLKQGLSFPAARAAALSESVPEAAEFLRQPNNILGLEYCLALKKRNSRILPCTHGRTGGAVHGDAVLPAGSERGFASASSLRSALFRSIRDPEDASRGTVPARLPDDIRRFIPGPAADMIDTALKSGELKPLCPDDFSPMLQYQLLLETADSLTSYLDISEDLAARIFRNRHGFTTFSGFIRALQARNLTGTQISRALIHILLGIKKEHLGFLKEPQYVRVLGCREESKDALSLLNRKSLLPVVSRAQALSDYSYDRDVFAANLYETAASSLAGRPFAHEYSRPLVVL